MNDSIKLDHIAIIPDGNRRWAKDHGLPSFEGHRRGFDSIQKIGKEVRRLGIKTMTVWAFSTENWKRSPEEIEYLMGIYEEWIEENLTQAMKDKTRIIHLGRKDRIKASLRNKIKEAEEKTKKFDKYYLAVALDYGGKDEIVRAIQKIEKLNVERQALNEKDFNQFLDTRDLPQPSPDLVIRTSGEYRTSGFLLWQTAYSEYIFLKKYLPDFTLRDLRECIEEYKNRKRRFGQ